VKFVDEVSGIPVDLSFNNDTGVAANETVQKWKEHHPAMPILASVIKQFLMIRGLNDVATGGLGGFSIICLVTSLLQHLPGTMPFNLGQALVEFFNLYGNLLDRNAVAIRMDPPGYIDKVSDSSCVNCTLILVQASYKPHLFNRDQPGRLTIIDPSTPQNNLSGGTGQIRTIFSCFASAHRTLQAKLDEYADTASRGSFSFLRDLIGGDFSAYTTQRTRSQSLFYGLTGQQVIAPANGRPAVPKASGHPTTPAPGTATQSPPAALNSSTTMVGRILEPLRTLANLWNRQISSPGDSKKSTPAEKRASRMKIARPELAKRIGKSINRPKAISLGGYKDEQEMTKDIDNRIKAMNR
jgi:non-canonical poly(A) RNA polymerase PAPD5/7